ncbi:MAG: hypothetical protein PHR04_00985 [Syntrophomonadaceae bacterium]|nr:hypothetical protein [Syntrophomonadaceae bacterium]
MVSDYTADVEGAAPFHVGPFTSISNNQGLRWRYLILSQPVAEFYWVSFLNEEI